MSKKEISPSKRSANLSQSEIRAMTIECLRVDGINMAQGVCDLDVPDSVIAGAKEAIDSGINTYTSCEGLIPLRQAIAKKMARLYGLEVDPANEVVVSIGATGAFYASCLAALDPGDEVIIFEPYYGYHAATLASLGCIPKYLRLQPPNWDFCRDDLESLLSGKTKAIIVNSPSNPLGKVFSRHELEMIASFASGHNLIVFTDEIYEHFVYDEFTHLPLAKLPGMKERTITISGFSKIFSITGWRLGYALCPPKLADAIAYFNDLVYVCAPAPLQIGATKGLLELDDSYYEKVKSEHKIKRDKFCTALINAKLPPFIPQGAYYVLADISEVPGYDDKEKANFILEKTGIACVPGRAFFHDDSGRNYARFCFAKKDKVLDEACERLKSLKL